MTTEVLPDGEITGSRVKIGAEAHPMRTAMWIGGAVIALGAVFAFYHFSAASDAPKLQALEEFRAAYAQKCGATEFAGPTPAFVRDQYLNSPKLEEVVTKQAEALRGNAACADVEQALKAASFPMAAKSHTP